ncbi:alginate lyase family protein [Marinobacterium lutimaris]|uniref:Poly(Beta-D-mannuronate) lyase n=1 Tax=Marinobacterium lutimaris TaxID=568106 RepID=A0A1H6CVJ7_9GAMM|nr:alginate lyase family protein [Marinobacterium lutimaris]SEG77109.1 poly(beta-D-mannuronate) lyase [Marinobacterium lutimaris]
MSKRICAVALPMLGWLIAGVPVQAAESIWPERETAQSVLVAEYQDLSCPRSPPEPYTGHLQLDSKYDQSDASKSKVVGLPEETAEIKEWITEYFKGVAKIVGYFEKADSAQEANVSLACLDLWLDSWAEGGALLSRDSSSNGKAARKWALAAISSTLMKVDAISDGKYRRSASLDRWLRDLAEAVIDDYTPRQTLEYRWFNNHDYWAAWAVSSTGQLLNRDAYLEWADVTLHLALEQMVPTKDGKYRHLPMETARGNRAVDYTHYALVPLVLLVEAAEVNDLAFSADDQNRMAGLAGFAIQGVLDPSSLDELTVKQKKVGSHKMVWLLPFLQQQPRHVLARELYREQGEEVGSYSQIGGNIRVFYPDL